jgi:hypothetical protein
MYIQCVHKRMVQFQTLTRNLILTLHGHKVHRQQRQLSKFLMRYQQFASHAYCGDAGPVSKMASQQEKAFCVLGFEVSTSEITVQREFRAARFRKDAPCMVLCARVKWETDFLFKPHNSFVYNLYIDYELTSSLITYKTAHFDTVKTHTQNMDFNIESSTSSRWSLCCRSLGTVYSHPPPLNLTLQTCTKWWAPTSASKWRMGFNSAFKGFIK